MNKAYERINWENYPSENTALNEENLNKMDAALNEVDNRVVAHETTKLDVATANSMVKNVSFNERSGIFTITYLNGSTKELDTKLEKIATNFVYDEERQKLILTLIDGTTQEIDMSALITQYEFENSAYIKWTVVSGKVKAEIINGSITADKLQPNFLADVTLQANSAKTSEQNAKVSEENAKKSEINAKNYADSAEPVASTANGLNPTLDNSTDAPIISFKGDGATIQYGTPTSDNEVPIYGVGESGVLAVKSTGKNLFDESKSVFGFVKADLTQISASTYKISERYPIGEYVVSWGSTTAEYIYLIYYNDSGKIIKRTVVVMSGKNSVQVAQESGASYFSVMYTVNGGDNGTSFVYDLQIEKGTVKTDYEPYTETSADIPLSSPLYESDYITYNMDGTGEESHKQQEMILDGSEAWVMVRGTTKDYFYIAIGEKGSVVTHKISCSHFTQGLLASTNENIGIDLINSSASDTSRIAVRPNIEGVTDVDTWKAWLAENKPKVVYEMTEPTVTPLTAEQIAEFEKLRSFDGTTHVTCEAESEVQYFYDSVSGKAVASVVDKVERQLSDFDITLARTSITATSAFNKTKFDRSILSDFDYETGQVMSEGGDDLSVADALAHLEGAVIDIMNGVIANKAKIDALSS